MVLLLPSYCSYGNQYQAVTIAATAVGTSATVNTTLLHHSAGNSTIDSTELGAALDQVGKDEFVIMVVQPLQAYDIWTAALALDRIRWPFWYFGMDGVTAFDPVDTNSTDPTLVNALQGEIGVAPHGNGVTQSFFLPVTLIACMVGLASLLAGAHHMRLFRSDSLAATAATSLIAWLLVLLAMGLACKEIHTGGYRPRRLKVVEALMIILALFELLYLLALHAGFRRLGSGTGAGVAGTGAGIGLGGVGFLLTCSNYDSSSVFNLPSV